VDWKIVFAGGIAYYLAQFLVSIVLGQLIHAPDTGVLAESYRATAAFWRPELSPESFDPRIVWRLWLPSGLIGAFLAAGAFSVIRPALAGPPWRQGLKFGVIALVFAIVNALGYNGIFNLPGRIWVWWMVGAAVMYLAAGPVLGWVSGKLAPPRKRPLTQGGVGDV
jgi:hypothetical protein